MHALLLTLLASLAGCMVEVSASSRTHLGPQESGGVTSHSVEEVALEATRLFEIRRFMLIDQHADAPSGGRVLKFIGRPFMAEIPNVPSVETATGNDIGSVFYVWVAPTEAGSTIHLLGKPTLRGTEPCTRDGVWLPCTPLKADQHLVAAYLTGHFETDIARGILSELALEGYVTGPLPPDAPVPNAVEATHATDQAAARKAAEAARLQACRAERREILRKAIQETDPETRRDIINSAPSCPRDPQEK